MVSVLKEQENFLRNAILTVDHSKEALQCFLDQHLKNNHQTFEDFLNQNQHVIYHLYYDAKCCQCASGPLQRKKRILFASTMGLLFDKNKQLSVHKTTRHSDFCCCYAKSSVTTSVLDLTLARCLLLNCCIDMFWYSCLAFKGVTLEQFLNSNRHILYHLWKGNTKCCKCQPDFIFPCNPPIIMENEWKKMFSSTLPPCENDRKRPASGAISICAFAASPSITVQQIHFELQNKIIQYCCTTRKSVEKLAELRNSTFGHVKKASMSCTEFNTFMSEAEDAILDIATVCGKEDYYRQMLLDLRDKPLDTRMFCQYEKVLLQTINNYEDIIKDNELLKDGIDSLKENIEKLDMLQRGGSKRQRLIDQTATEIENHCKDGVYAEIKAVKHCIKILENKNVVVLSGREGCGKSRNSLEILRQMKEQNKDCEVFKFTGLQYVSDIIKYNVISIVLFDNVFYETNEHILSSKTILDHLYSYTCQNKVKLIIVMRNTESHKCKSLLSTHRVFHDSDDIDLNSWEFKLTHREKVTILTNYCRVNQVQIFDRQDMSEITETDPFLGFPECCRLLTENKHNTVRPAIFFRLPSHALVNEIDTLRIEGKDNYVKRLKYATLIYMLVQITSDKGYQDYLADSFTNNYLLVLDNIDIKSYEDVFNVCFHTNMSAHSADIKLACEELSGRYLKTEYGGYCFQHQAVQYSVLISYSKINPKAIIPLLSFNHMTDIIKLHCYTEHTNETVIKISKADFDELAKQIILVMENLDSCYSNMHDELKNQVETSLIEDNIDLVYQLIDCMQDKNVSFSGPNMTNLLFYLLRTIEKIENNTFTTNHVQAQMFNIELKHRNIAFSLNPSKSVRMTLWRNCDENLKWLLSKTVHYLLNLDEILEGFIETRDCEKYFELLIQNLDHSKIDMTELFTVAYFCSGYDNFELSIINLILDSVDNSFINYNLWLLNISLVEYKLGTKRTKMILHVIEKIDENCENNDIFFSFTETLIDYILRSLSYFCWSHEHCCGFAYDCNDYRQIVELLIAKPGVKYSNIEELLPVVCEHRWFCVLEILIEQDVDRSLQIHEIIGTIDECDDEHWKEIIQFISQNYIDDININEIMQNAIKEGNHIMVDNLLDYFDHQLFNFSMIFDKLFSEHVYSRHIYMYREYEAIFESFIKKVDPHCINLNSIMKAACQFRLSKWVISLLENKPSFHFNLKNIMYNACFHGELILVKYLSKKYNAAEFNYKMSMIKICRNSQTETADVCEWLWENIDHGQFEMNKALTTACRCHNYKIVKWMLQNVEMVEFDTETVVLSACEYGVENIVKLLLDTFCINELDFQYAVSLACRNEIDGLQIAKSLYERAIKSKFYLNDTLSIACKSYRCDIAQWIIETCDESRNDNTLFFKSSKRNLLDNNLAIDCILNMDNPEKKIENEKGTKEKLLGLILKQTDPMNINFYKLITESCKNDWIEIFKWILGKVDNALFNIGEVINVACHNGATNIVKWSLENIDIQLLDADNVMIESCGFGWLECLVLVQKHCNQYNLHAAMLEACTYGHHSIANWLLQNCNYQCFYLPLLLKETGRNGWTDIFLWLVTNFHFDKSDLQIVTKEALLNGNQRIITLIFSKVGRDAFDLSSLSNAEFNDIKNENVVNYILRKFDPRRFDLAKIMTNACKFGWENVASFIIDNKSNCRYDSALSLIDISWFITGKHVNCLCDFTSAFNIACDNGEAEIVQLLIVHVNHKIFAVQKAMLSVCIKGWNEIATLLLDNFQHTRLNIGKALNEACRHGEMDVVQAILRRVNHNLLDVKTAVNGACENHMHEELVLWILKNIDHGQLDLTNVRKKAIKHNWRTVQLEMPEVEGLNQIEQETETDYIVIP